MQANELQIVARPLPFQFETVERTLPAGLTLSECLNEIGIPKTSRAWITIDGVIVHPKYWDKVKPRAGHLVNAGLFLHGGGDGGKNPLNAVLSIAVSLAAPGLGAALGTKLGLGTLGTSLLKAGIGIIGSSLVNAIAPPPKPRIGTTSPAVQARENPVFSVTGIGNQTNPYGPIPCLFGTRRMYPPNGANQYTEISGGEQFLIALFDFGYGPINFTDFRIGETPLNNFENVDIETRAGYADDDPLELYRNDVDQQSLGVLIEKASGSRVFETADNANEAILDFAFNGLVSFSSAGARQNRTVQVDVDYRLAGSADAYTTEGIISNSPVDSSAVTLLSSTSTSETYQADFKTISSVVNIHLGLLPVDNSFNQNAIINNSRQYRIFTRKQGETTWIQQQTISAVQYNTLGSLGINGPPVVNTSTTVTINVPVNAQMEYLIEITGGAGADPIVHSITYKTSSSGRQDYTDSSTELVLKSLRIKFPTADRYEIRVARVTDDTTSAQISDQMTLTNIKSITYQSPINAIGHALVALRIKATGQLNGQLDSFNAIPTRLLPVYDGAVWSDPEETRNPAWAYASILRHENLETGYRLIEDSQIDADGLLDWANDCDAAGFTINAIIDQRDTLYETLKDVAAVGYASPTMKNGTSFSIVVDKLQSQIKQHLSPRNMMSFRGTKNFADVPHALRIRFDNAALNNQPDEVIVYNNGYDENNATRFEVLELWGTIFYEEAYIKARRYLATLNLRPETYEIELDIEHLVVKRGNLAVLNHDVMLVGLGSGRIKSMTLDDNSGNPDKSTHTVTDITLDDIVEMEAAKSYNVRIRVASMYLDAANETSVLASVVTNAGEQTTLTFSTPLSAAYIPAVGDLVLFGETGAESLEVIIQNVYPRSDFSARVIMQDAAPEIFDVDNETIPEYVSSITVPSNSEDARPPNVIIDNVVSDESVLIPSGDGSYDPQVAVSFHLGIQTSETPEYIRAQWRISGASNQWIALPDLPVNATLLSLKNIVSGEYVDIRLGTVSTTGKSSLWTIISNHLVIGMSTPPAGVIDTRIEGNMLRWLYPSPPVDFDGFKIRHRAGTLKLKSGAIEVPGLIPVNEFDLSAVPSGQRVIMINAVDKQGNESTDTSFVVRELGDPLIENLVFSYDFVAEGYPGTITDGTIDGGLLKADSTGTDYLSNGSALYLNDPDALYLPVNYKEMVYTTELIPEYEETNATLTIDLDIEGEGWELCYRDQGNDLYLPDPDELYLEDPDEPYLQEQGNFVPWPGSITVSHQKYEFQLTISASATRGIINTLTANIDVPDESETLEDISISASGTRLPITKNYRSIKHISIDMQDDGGTAESFLISDKDPELGPLLYARDNNQSNTTALIDAHIRGIRQ